MILSLTLAMQVVAGPPMAREPIRHVRLLASTVRIWDPETLQPVVIVPYAVAIDGILRRDSPTTVPLELDAWNAAGKRTQQRSTLSFRLADAHVQDFLVLPMESRQLRLALTVDPGNQGRAGRWADTVVAIPPDSVMLSDIVIGPSTGTPRAFDQIALLPRLAIERGEMLEVFMQAWSTLARDNARARLQVLRMHGPERVPEVEISVTFDQPISAGLNTIVKEIDSTRLLGGLYIYRYQLLTPDGAVLAERERLLGFMDGVE